MSKTVDKKIPCPKCGHEQDFTMWTSINLVTDPHVREAVLNQSLFRFRCDKCNYAAPLSYPCVYNDPKNKLVFYQFPKYENKDLENLDNEQSREMIDNGYTFRVVRNGNELAEKIVIFENKLDDRVVELCKLYMMRELKKQRSDFKPMGVYYNHGKDGHVVVAFDPQGKGVSALLPEELYQTMEKSFEPQLEEYASEEELVVDAQWALEALKASQPDNHDD